MYHSSFDISYLDQILEDGNKQYGNNAKEKLVKIQLMWPFLV